MTAHGVRVESVAADAADPDAARAVADAASAIGPVEILVLNAGGPPTVDPTATDARGLAAQLPAPCDDADRAGHTAPARHAGTELGADRRRPVERSSPADPRPRVLDRRPGGACRVAEDGSALGRGRRRDGQRRHAGEDRNDRDPRARCRPRGARGHDRGTGPRRPPATSRPAGTGDPTSSVRSSPSSRRSPRRT